MTKILVAYLSVLTTKRNFCQRDLLLRLFPELRMWPLLKSHIIGIFRSGCSVFFLTEGIRKNISWLLEDGCLIGSVALKGEELDRRDHKYHRTGSSSIWRCSDEKRRIIRA